VIDQSAIPRLSHGLHTMCYSRAWEAKLDAAQVGCYRKALRIKTAYVSRLLEGEPVRNVDVMQRASARPLSQKIWKSRFVLLGHILRRGGR